MSIETAKSTILELTRLPSLGSEWAARSDPDGSVYVVYAAYEEHYLFGTQVDLCLPGGGNRLTYDLYEFYREMEPWTPKS